MKYLKETTKWDGNTPNHTYIFDNDKVIGYIKEGTEEELMFKKPWNNFSKKGRTFVKL